MGVSTAVDAALAAANPRLGIFLRMDITPAPIRIWLGIGDCRAGIDATDGSGAIYSGLGELLTVPMFQQLVNGSAERVEFSLNGVSARVLQMANASSDTVKGAMLLVGIGAFDSDWQLSGSPVWLRRFIIDYLTVKYEQSEEGGMRTVSLSARTFFTGRRRPQLTYYTDRDQQTFSPGDRFCERVAIYSQEVNKTWPRF